MDHVTGAQEWFETVSTCFRAFFFTYLMGEDPKKNHLEHMKNPHMRKYVTLSPIMSYSLSLIFKQFGMPTTSMPV